MQENNRSPRQLKANEIWCRNNGVSEEDIEFVDGLFQDSHDAKIVNQRIRKARGDRWVNEKRRR